MLIRLRDQERGAALIVALLVTFVVLLLSLFVVQLSLHNTTASSYDRMRVQSLTAAEAGVNDFFNVLLRTAPQYLPCNSPGIGLHPGPVTGSVQIFPGTASYTVEANYFDASTQPLGCAQLGQDKVPAAVSITSTGTTNGRVPRKMQAYANLIKQRSGGFNAAIVADKGLCLSGNFTLTDAQGQSFAADIYLNSGNLCFGVQSAGNSTVGGKIYVHDGSASFGGNLTIRNDVWAWGAVALQNTQTTVQGAVTTSSALASISGDGEIDANAKAGSTIVCSSKSNPAILSSCTSVSNNKDLVIKGQSVLRDSPQDAHPPTATVPPVCWQPTWLDCQATESQWINAGYTIVTTNTCLDAQNYLKNLTVTANTVLRVTYCNDLVIDQTTVNMGGNLAIFTDGRILLNSKNTFTKTGGDGNLFFISGYRPNVTPTSCPTPAQTYYPTTSYDIRFNNNPDYVNLKVSFYTPGAIIFNNQTKSNGFTGQILGGQVCSSNNFAMSYTSVPAPGVSPISGFGQDVLWVREIA